MQLSGLFRAHDVMNIVYIVLWESLGFFPRLDAPVAGGCRQPTAVAGGSDPNPAPTERSRADFTHTSSDSASQHRVRIQPRLRGEARDAGAERCACCVHENTSQRAPARWRRRCASGARSASDTAGDALQTPPDAMRCNQRQRGLATPWLMPSDGSCSGRAAWAAGSEECRETAVQSGNGGFHHHLAVARC